MRKSLKNKLTGIICLIMSMTISLSACTKASTNVSSSSSDQSSSVSEDTTSSGSEDTSTDATTSSDTSDGTSGDGETETDVTGITLDSPSISLKVGQVFGLDATVTTSSGSDYTGTVTWTSADTSIAIVSSGLVYNGIASGAVKGIGIGETTVTAAAGGYSATCKVTVTKATPYTTAISLDKTTLSLVVGGEYTFTPTVTMSDGSDYEGDIEWKSGNTNVVTITDEGKATAVGTGEAEIAATVWTASGTYLTDYCTVTVTQASGDIITAAEGYEESLYVTWTTSVASNDTVKYKLSTDEKYTTLSDENLITSVSSTEARADIVGLAAGNYDIQIISGGVTYKRTVTVSAYDRSGYAHFNYTDGVGAYNDDGTLKDNTLVIYLTDSNKNDISNSCYVYDADTGNYTQADITSYYPDGANGCYSIGYLLNNSKYENQGIAALSQTYGSVAIRVIGLVNAEVSGDGTASQIKGLTPYASSDSLTGGGTKDNGRMACMRNAKNLTIEGIGKDAAIYGWGFSFSSATDDPVTDGYGYGFEVRNLTFSHYSEDAIGMEGVKSDPSGSVERCWIHNNSFYQGYCASPAENDKGEGDGTCDFKRGQYYTFSWNYMYNCHKTNLIGADSTNEQYNISMHHNYYDQVQSRQPLVRTANVHYYNNYVYGATSYVISSRSSAYVFAESNYFESCKNVLDLSTDLGDSDTGWGDYKGYLNTYDSCTTSGDSITPADVSNKNDTITNKDGSYINKYIYFENDSNLIYSNFYLTDAATAKEEVIANAGAHSTGNPASYMDTSSSSDISLTIDSLVSAGTLSSGDITTNTGLYSANSTTITALATNSQNSSNTYNQQVTVGTGNSAYGYSYMLQLNGGGTSTYRSIKLELSGAATITVYAISGGSSERTLGLYELDGETFNSLQTGAAGAKESTTLSQITFTVDSSGTYYISSASGGINIYYIAISY